MTGRMIRAALACVLACGMGAAQTDAQAGRAKAKICAVCHGELGVSTLPNAPNLAGQPEIHLAEQLKAYRSGKRSDEIMDVSVKPLTNADITDLAAWFASIVIEEKLPK
jgi:cytochrome c553